ncbi:restriction endonuclease subunit S [Brachyspira intermedia]|uniref:restriction endonuclease subunit S n=1 Tax=Brachyspira intermedia TaxID=84377 RepID=UPI003003B717
MLCNDNVWKKLKISDCAEVVCGGTPSTSKSEYWDGNISWITPKDLSNYNSVYISKGNRNISELGLNNSSAKLLPKNTILLTTRAPIGYIAIAKNELSTNQGFKSLIMKNGNIPEFFYYLLKNNIEIIKNLGNGTTFMEVNSASLKNLELPIPPLEEQKKIASILSSLDDKIELNNRMNKILEETAQTIFKEWFINFNFPNEEGKPYKKSGGKMIESELGEIPGGWEVTSLENILKVIKGKKTKETHIKKTDLLNSQYLTIDCYNNSNIEYTEYVEKMYVDKLDIIMVMDGASSGKLFYGKNGILSSTMAKFYVENKNINEIVFFFLKKIENEIMYHTTGSAIPHANKQFILNKKIALPPKQLLNLTNYIKTIREKIISNVEENQKLTGIRDSILPKLMSGEIRIK